MKITGELLKAERLKKNISVSEVANTLKLSSKIINSIESGDINELPAKTFIRGFVKSYAQYLKLDDELILRQFQEEMGSTQPLPKTPPPVTTKIEDKEPASGKSQFSKLAGSDLALDKDTQKKTILYVSVACGLLACIVIINSTIEKYHKESVIDKNKIEQIQPINPTLSSEIATMPNTENTPNKADPTVVLPDASLDKKQLSSPVEKKDATVSTATLAEANSPASNLPDDFEPASNKPVELMIEAKKEVEFYYAKGNTKNFTHVKLSPKEIHIIRSPSGIHLKADDGSLFNIILNGAEKGPGSSTSKPVRLSF
ncbi:MAG: helix-turn-helix domain-containing protein [Pseudobdellovibrio sp.]